MVSSRSIAIGAALLTLTLSPTATAQVLTERLRVQGGFNTQLFPAPTPRREDAWVGAVPGLTLFVGKPEALFSVSYQLTAAPHWITQGTSSESNEIDHFGTLAGAFELSTKTHLLVAATVAHSTLTNVLIINPAAATQLSLLPAAPTRILSLRADQSLLHDLSPDVKLDESANVASFKPLPSPSTFGSISTSLGGGIERLWGRNGVGGEVRAGYSSVVGTPPVPDQQSFTFSAGPRWRRDWSAEFNTVLSAGATVVVSPDRGTKPILAPRALATAQYAWSTTTLALTASAEIAPSLLTLLLTRTERVGLHGSQILSERHHVVLGSSVSLARANILDLTGGAETVSFNNVLTDVDLTWTPLPVMDVFARYQFIAQIGDVTTAGVNPSYLGDTFLVGVQLASRPPGGGPGGAGAVPTTFSERVDQRDGALPDVDRNGRENDNGRNNADENEQRDEPEGLAPRPAPPSGPLRPRPVDPLGAPSRGRRDAPPDTNPRDDD
jgi:hypothetical protein